jgi:hypothetical protein
VAQALAIRCEAGDFERLRERTGRWDGTLDDTLRAELGAAARATANDARKAALRLRLPGAPPARRPGGRRSTGLRSGIASSVDVVLRGAAGKGVEYRIRADHPMARVTNAVSFRHPVYGNRSRWVSQLSQPWWDLSIDRNRAPMRDSADQALSRAIRRF